LLSKNLHNKEKYSFLSNFKENTQKNLFKEKDLHTKLHSKFEEIKSFYSKYNDNPIENESKNLLNNEDHDNERQDFKVKDDQIKYYQDIAKYRSDKMKYINEQAYYIKKLSDDARTLTVAADVKIDSLADNVEQTVHNQKETYKMLLQNSKEEKSFKDNKCCVIFLISLALLFLMMILINMNRN